MKMVRTILFLLLIGNSYCLSNDILWQRVPSNMEDLVEYKPQNCVYSADGNFIVTINQNNYEGNWIGVYNANSGFPINSIYFDDDSIFSRCRIVKIFARSDSNIVCVLYWSLHGNTTYIDANYYEIPSLKLLDTIQMQGWPDDITNNFEQSLFKVNNKFVLRNNKTKVIFEDSLLVSNLSQNGGSSIKLAKFSNDNKYILLTTKNKYSFIYDIESKKIHWSDTNSQNINYVSLSSNNKFLIIAYDNSIDIIDFATNELIKSIDISDYNPNIMTVDISPNNKIISAILTYNFTSDIYIYNIESGNLVTEMLIQNEFVNPPNSIYGYFDFYFNQIFSVDSKHLLVSGNLGNYLFDLESGKLMDLFTTFSDTYRTESFKIKFLNNNDALITATSDKYGVWNSKTGKFINAINCYGSSPYQPTSSNFDIHPDSKQLIYFGADTIYFYDIIEEKLVKHFVADANITFLSVSGNGKYLGYTMVNNYFEIYDLEQESVIYRGEIYTNNGYVPYGIEMSFDSLCMVISIKKNGSMILGYKNQLYNFLEKKEIINSAYSGVCKFYKDEMMLSLNENSIDINKPKKNPYDWFGPVKTIKTKALDFVITPNGKYVITSGPVIWDIETLDSIQLHAEPELGDMDFLDISSDGKLLAAISEEGRIVVWDIEKYVTDVEEMPISEDKGMISIFPNPVSENAKIVYQLDDEDNITIKIFDLLGQKISTIFSGNQTSGKHEININTNLYTQGQYILVLKNSKNIGVAKFNIIK